MNRLYVFGGAGAFLLLACGLTALAAPAGQAAPPAAPQGNATCTTCHDPGGLEQSRHGNHADTRTPGCQSCHGASADHLKDAVNAPDVVFGAASKHLSPADVRNASCLTCHETKVLPRTNWMGSQHQRRGVACTDCHQAHTPDQRILDKRTQSDVCLRCHKDQRAQIRRISTHPLATTGLDSKAQMSCADCHNPHGSTGPTLLIKNSVNETCYTCHAEKRGPFLWEHAPVTDNCANCHTPHGSTNPSLLKTRVPWLCQTCHSGDHGAQINSGANLAGGNVTTVNGQQTPGAAAPRAQLAARACLNCHVLVHGSNHPAGAKFQR
jgi:DmsE family decaheme c-type cytochrome